MAEDMGRLSVFPSELSSIPQARHFVRSSVSDYLPVHALDTVELLTSEVVTNAVLHADSDPVVEVAAEGGTVRISVQDQNPAWPSPKRVCDDATSGRGLALVDTMADAWGVESLPKEGKRIWFEVRGCTIMDDGEPARWSRPGSDLVEEGRGSRGQGAG